MGFMKKIKVTNLEKFVEQHIRLPYQNSCAESNKVFLHNVIEYAEKYPQWWQLVIGRINAIGFRMPKYINHPLKTFLKL